MEADKQTHQFKPSSTFENAVALYEFDNELRQLLFSAIQRIEVALRSKIIQHFSMQHGAFWFMQMQLHDSEHRFQLLTHRPVVHLAEHQFVFL